MADTKESYPADDDIDGWRTFLDRHDTALLYEAVRRKLLPPPPWATVADCGWWLYPKSESAHSQSIARSPIARSLSCP